MRYVSHPASLDTNPTPHTLPHTIRIRTRYSRTYKCTKENTGFPAGNRAIKVPGLPGAGQTQTGLPVQFTSATPVRCWSYGTQHTHVRYYVHSLLPLAFIEFVAQLLACKLMPLAFCVHWLTEERGQQQRKMEHGTLHELMNTISSLYQWECTLKFPDL